MADEDDFLVNNPNDINPLYLMKKEEKLEGDGSTPFSPPDGELDDTDDTHPLTDTNIEPAERYDEGIEGASEANITNTDLIEDETTVDNDEDDDDDIVENTEITTEVTEEDTEEEQLAVTNTGRVYF